MWADGDAVKRVAVLLILTASSCAINNTTRAAGCYVEPSKTPGGTEIIYYPTAMVHTIPGIPTVCPS